VEVFVPAPWLPGPHLQTLWGPLVRERSAVEFQRELLVTPDDDDLYLDHVTPLGPRARVVLLHGLEGSSRSVYAQALSRALVARGVAVSALNFRSCARDPQRPRRWIPNRRPRLYHSGETADPGFVLRTLAAREPNLALGAIGVSLGGNALLKWLGEDPANDFLKAAAAISAPVDLLAGSRHLETAAGVLYVASFLRTLRAKAEALTLRFPEARARIDLARFAAARSFFEFDDAATAPLHGFTGAPDYYARCSALGFLPRIRTPTLAIGSEDDPFLPAEALHRARRAAPEGVEVRVTRHGGHVGFVSGFLGASYWAEEQVVAWIVRRLVG